MDRVIEDIYNLYLECDYVSIDSREVQALITEGRSVIFFALQGENFNGNDYVVPVIGMGAKYAVCSDKLLADVEGVVVVDDVLECLTQLAKRHRNELKHPHIAVTGSNGKTTTKELLFSVLNKKYCCYATSGNLNNHIGVPLTILRTPKSATLSVIEMGANHIGEIEHLCLIAQPNYGVITNIGRAHLEGFGGVEGVRKAKGELFDYLQTSGGEAIYLLNSNELRGMVAEREGLVNHSYTVDDMKPLDGVKLSVVYDGEVVNTNLIGEYNIYNIATAAAIGRLFGVEKSDIISALMEYNPTNNRSQMKKYGSCEVIIDAYNANPTSMEIAINNFDKIAHNKKVMIIGEMKELGGYSLSEHIKVLKDISGMKSEIIELILVGEEFKKCLEEYSPQSEYKYFGSINDLRPYFESRDYDNCLILIKGSNSTKLYSLIG